MSQESVMSDAEFAQYLKERRGRKPLQTEPEYKEMLNSAETINLQMKRDARLQEFREKYSEIRDARIEFAVLKNDLIQKLDLLINERESLINEFQREAETLYPELKGENALQVLQGLAPAHPLWNIWKKYDSHVVKADKQIAQDFSKHQTLQALESKTEAEEGIFATKYNSFRDSTNEKVPPIEVLSLELSLPVETDPSKSTLITSKVSALDIVDNEARASIINELSSTETLAPSQNLEVSKLPVETKPIDKRILWGGILTALYLIFT